MLDGRTIGQKLIDDYNDDIICGPPDLAIAIDEALAASESRVAALEEALRQIERELLFARLQPMRPAINIVKAALAGQKETGAP